MFGANLNWETDLIEWNSRDLEANVFQILGTFQKEFKIKLEGDVYQPEDSEYQFAWRFRRLDK